MENRTKNILLIKKLIWLYIGLVIFEGALRKWFLPFLSTPLLIVRDPLVLFVLLKSYRIGIFKITTNGYLIVTFFITYVSILLALLLGHGSLGVGLFGARIFMLHFPFMFLIGKVLDLEDVITIGKWFVYISFPMMLLIAIQFYSPQSAWVNIGVGGNTSGAGFSGAEGYFRPPGTFSFTSGNSLFWGIIPPFLFYFLLNKTNIKSIFLILSVISILGAVAFSISRTIFFQIILTIGFILPIISIKPKLFKNVFIGFVLISVTLFLLINFSESVQVGISVFESRFTSANKAEGGVEGVLIDRFLGGMASAITMDDLPVFGYGIGMGTNVGSRLLTGTVTFLASEGEWGRLVSELGLILGFSLIVVRISLVIKMISNSIIQLKRYNILPWLLLSFGSLQILQGQWGQPTSLGFSTFVGGLILASYKGKTKKNES